MNDSAFTAVDVDGQLPTSTGFVDPTTGAVTAVDQYVSCKGVSQVWNGPIAAVLFCILHPSNTFDVTYTCTDGFCLSDTHKANAKGKAF